MMWGGVPKITLLTLLVLSMASSAHGWSIATRVQQAITDYILKPIAEVVFGGSTAIVTNALTYSFLGETRDDIIRHTLEVLISIIKAVITAIVTFVIDVIRKVATAIFNSVVDKIRLIAEIKKEILATGFRLFWRFVTGNLGNLRTLDIDGGDNRVFIQLDTAANAQATNNTVSNNKASEKQNDSQNKFTFTLEKTEARSALAPGNSMTG